MDWMPRYLKAESLGLTTAILLVSCTTELESTYRTGEHWYKGGVTHSTHVGTDASSLLGGHSDGVEKKRGEPIAVHLSFYLANSLGKISPSVTERDWDHEKRDREALGEFNELTPTFRVFEGKADLLARDDKVAILVPHTPVVGIEVKVDGYPHLTTYETIGPFPSLLTPIDIEYKPSRNCNGFGVRPCLMWEEDSVFYTTLPTDKEPESHFYSMRAVPLTQSVDKDRLTPFPTGEYPHTFECNSAPEGVVEVRVEKDGVAFEVFVLARGAGRTTVSCQYKFEDPSGGRHTKKWTNTFEFEVNSPVKASKIKGLPGVWKYCSTLPHPISGVQTLCDEIRINSDGTGHWHDSLTNDTCTGRWFVNGQGCLYLTVQKGRAGGPTCWNPANSGDFGNLNPGATYRDGKLIDWDAPSGVCRPIEMKGVSWVRR